MHRFANPNRFLRLAAAIVPWSAAAAVLLFGVGLTYALVLSPPDYQQSETVRIMYVHVPAAWMAMGAYAFLALASAVAIVWRHPLADLAAKACAPIGAGFTAIALVTGALWGQPTWGTWWVWDARLTSVLILLFLYLGYMALWNAFDDQSRGARAAGILALVGVVNLPIIKFSVDWWSTLHQPASVFRADGPTMPDSLLTPLFLMFFAFTLLFVTLQLLAMHTEIRRRRLVTLERRAARGDTL